jgi:acetylornithine/N-succinyldiaminopimelate aminotransferase
MTTIVLPRRYPLTIARGEGCNLYTTDGKEYLDFVAGIATCALGHNNADLNVAIAHQMATVHHVSNLYLIPAQAGLATWLTDNSVADKVFFCNSGAEANEAAIKCARRHAYNRGITKPIIITAHQSFHGRTLGSLSATGQPKYHKGFGYDGQMVPGFSIRHVQ